MRKERPKTLSVPAAGRQYFNLGKNASYAAAARGEIPVIRIGSRLRAPIAALDRMLGEATPQRENNYSRPETQNNSDRARKMTQPRRRGRHAKKPRKSDNPMVVSNTPDV